MAEVTNRRARRLAVCNQKGGVGKTATTLGLAGALVESGRRVLIVDWDPQGHGSEALGAPETTYPATVAQRILGKWTGPAHELVWRHSTGIDVLPTNLDSFVLAPHLYPARGAEFRLSSMLDELDNDYDDILIDCPPELGVLTDNALWAARRADGTGSGVIIPALSEDSSLRALRLLLDQLNSLQRELNVTVDLHGLVINLYDRRRGEIVVSTKNALSSLPGLDTIGVVDDLKWVREAWRAKTPVVQHAPASPTAETYREITKTLGGGAA